MFVIEENPQQPDSESETEAYETLQTTVDGQPHEVTIIDDDQVNKNVWLNLTAGMEVGSYMAFITDSESSGLHLFYDGWKFKPPTPEEDQQRSSEEKLDHYIEALSLFVEGIKVFLALLKEKTLGRDETARFHLSPNFFLETTTQVLMEMVETNSHMKTKISSDKTKLLDMTEAELIAAWEEAADFLQAKIARAKKLKEKRQSR